MRADRRNAILAFFVRLLEPLGCLLDSLPPSSRHAEYYRLLWESVPLSRAEL